ncbi:HAD-IA family hydrolase [Aestuariirhabdus sp. Z084]|uniref:HAD family hydrolase n=1 Tax=Aestuariirhabdus haliotis TaxID=2918751 RepID=UPI00201B3C4D|nr:HAD-IA family hydrolase [Aestuariirhabdus haliotis]MCL6416999.1 HAD-IA family hydrolase [Aestuariirhabdus haliotis]MCL6421032.1 HAD-IA family hydrolase [Aestuariirhabdus haliotis]
MTNTSLDCVLFDLDGTLLDTAPDFVTVLNQLLADEQRPTLADAAIRATVSNGARALITLGFDIQEGEPGFESLRQKLLDLYEAQLGQQTRAFAGIDNLLSELEFRSISWGVVTNKPSRYTNPLLEKLGYLSRCATVVCPDQVSHTKPHPEPMLLACKQASCTPASTIYIGDHERDIQAGHNAGMPTIAALYGYLDDDIDWQQWQATHQVHHANEILPWLERLDWQAPSPTRPYSRT